LPETGGEHNDHPFNRIKGEEGMSVVCTKKRGKKEGDKVVT